MNKTIERDGFTDDTTIWANVTLPSLSDGLHTVTVYWGWYFLEGIKDMRFLHIQLPALKLV